MPKIGLLAFTTAAIAVAGVSYAADKIMLACSDLVTDEVYSFVIDLDRKIVSGTEPWTELLARDRSLPL